MLNIGGLVPFSTIDYPKHFSAVFFCQGCPFHCRYCHNPHLRTPSFQNPIALPQIIRFLKRRQGFLEAVVFSGGEPTLQKKLPEILKAIKELGFKIGLHTTGIYPKRLKTLLPLVDWIGFDIKAPFEDYPKITQVKHSGQKARKSLELILESKKKQQYECRTTAHPLLLSLQQMIQIKNQLKGYGITDFTVQKFQEKGCLDAELKGSFNHNQQYYEKIQATLQNSFANFQMR